MGVGWEWSGCGGVSREWGLRGFRLIFGESEEVDFGL